MDRVIVIGGGPAGSTVATILAQAGIDVVVFEREHFPRFQIGESLMPGTYWTFARLGVLEQLRQSAFAKKHSVQFFGSSGRGSTPFYFSDSNPHESSITWQVVRSEFDKLLLDHARASGAVVHQGARVLDILFDDDRATGVQARLTDGREEAFSAGVVVDATGQSALISRRLQLTAREPNLRKASIYTHFSGGLRDTGIDEGATLILHTQSRDAWFWYIPLSHNRVSVGVVGDLDYLFQDRRQNAQTIFDKQVQMCEPVHQRLTAAEQLFPVRTTKDFSYRSRRIAGNGWVLVGDAFGFLDPIYSSGVYLALKSGEMAADTIIGAFATKAFSAAKLGSFGSEFVRGMEAVRKLVYAFYSKDFNFANFLKHHPECRQGVVDILSGNLYSEHVEPIFEPMAEMFELPQSVEWT